MPYTMSLQLLAEPAAATSTDHLHQLPNVGRAGRHSQLGNATILPATPPLQQQQTAPLSKLDPKKVP